MFDPKSRYAKVAPVHIIDARGRTVEVTPPAPPPSQTVRGLHARRQNERPDHLAALYLSDASGYWRLGEINDAMTAEVLTELRTVVIPDQRMKEGDVSLGAAILPNGLPDPTMPVPSRVQVVEALHRPTTYRLHYEFDSADGDFPLLTDGHLEPEKELAVMVMVDNLPKFLVSGPVTRHEIEVVNGGSGSSVDVVGGDHCIVMDREDKAKVWNNVTDALAVTALLAGYQLVPDVAMTTTLHMEFKHSLVQRETDLRFVRRLARRNGFWFWITSEAPMVNVAHFKRFSPSPSADVEFKLNVAGANIERVHLEWESERPVAAVLKQVSLSDKSVTDGSVLRSPLTGLAEKGLGDVAASPRSAHLAVAADDAADLTARAEALLIDHGWFVGARVVARLSVLKSIVRAHTVASLAGVGSRHSGTYVVARVVHDIDPSDHVMTVDLIRNGWN